MPDDSTEWPTVKVEYNAEKGHVTVTPATDTPAETRDAELLSGDERYHIGMWVWRNPGTAKSSGLTRLLDAYDVAVRKLAALSTLSTLPNGEV